MALLAYPFRLQSKHNDKYLCYIDKDPQLQGFLQFSGNQFPTPNSKFEAQPAKTVDGFVNIRSVYNKYWASRFENDEHWIVAEADEPNEDQSSSSCTLFQAISDHGTTRLLHVHLNKYVCLSKDSPQFPFCAGLVDADPDGFGVFVVVRYSEPSLSRPPQLYAFKGDNGKYLKVEVNEHDHVSYLKFSANDTHEPEVRFECPDISNSTIIRIKSISKHTFWRCDNKWVHPDTTFGDPNNTLFHVEWIDSPTRVVSLRVGSFYCRRFVHEHKSSKEDCLIADASTIIEEAKLELVKI